MKQEQHKRALLAIHTHTHIHNSMHTHTHTHACTHNLHTSHRKQTWTDAIVSDSRPCNSFSPRNTPPPPPPSPPTPHPPSPSPPTPSSEPSEFGVSGTATRASCEWEFWAAQLTSGSWSSSGATQLSCQSASWAPTRMSCKWAICAWESWAARRSCSWDSSAATQVSCQSASWADPRLSCEWATWAATSCVYIFSLCVSTCVWEHVSVRDDDMCVCLYAYMDTSKCGVRVYVWVQK